MKILLINGSPKTDGVINFAFDRIISKLDCETIKLNIPDQITNCINCRKCKDEHIICDSFIKIAIEYISKCDAIILGSPVYYGGITSQMKSFLTKLFYSSPKACTHKPIGLIVSSRRAGSVMALSEFALPFLMHSNIIVGSTYWNEIYGDNPSEAEIDYEGLQTLDNLVENLKYVVNGLSHSTKPEIKEIKHLNFISKEYIKLKGENKD